MTTIFLLGLAYLLGSIPFALIAGLFFSGKDVRRFGSGNVGASNLAYVCGWKVGVVAGIADILKGLFPVLIGQRMGLGYGDLAMVALAAVLGHDFSLFLHFRGGKGVATTIGVCLVLNPVSTFMAMVSWATAFRLWGYSAVASLLALASLPVFMSVIHMPTEYVILTTFLFILAAAKHWENILRLAMGQEEKG